MHRITLDFIVLVFVCDWIFNQLSFVKQPVKDIINGCVIVLLLALYFLPV